MNDPQATNLDSARPDRTQSLGSDGSTISQPSRNESGEAVAVAPPVLPGYEMLGELGAGAMGVVYKARDLGLHRFVAIKMIRTGTHASSSDLARFRVEAQVAAQLQHPNIVQVYEIGVCGDCPYIALEFVEGGSLAQKLEAARSASADAACLVETLARTMHVAHQNGIVHRDLKPGNVLLTRDGQPKIADFGLAKRLGGGSEQTQTGMVLGTPCYMAPEQASGQSKSVGPLADIYALGAILYELLAGRPPFRADTPLETLRQVVERPPAALRANHPAVPRDLETICLKSLHKEPQRRYASAEEMADDLARFRHNQPIKAKPPSRLGRWLRWGRRNPVMTLLATLTFISFAAVLLLAFLMEAKPKPTADASLQNVVQAGRLLIATDNNYPPMEFLENGQLRGFDIDLGSELARRLGVAADFVVVDWNWQDMKAKLEARSFDVFIATITITEERQREVEFVEYLHMPLVFVCRQGVAVHREADLAGKIVAVQTDTTGQKHVEKLKAKGIALKDVMLFQSTREPFAAIGAGKVDVIFVDEPVARYFVRQDASLTIMGAVGHAMDPDPIGIVFRKGDRALQNAVSEGLKGMRSDGAFTKLLEDWFGR